MAAVDYTAEVSTHSRLKAAVLVTQQWERFVCFNTQPPEGG